MINQINSSLHSIKRLTDEEQNLIMPCGIKVNANQTDNKQEQENETEKISEIVEIPVKLYFRRWLVLFTFAAISMMSAFNWIEYNIIQDLVVYYYNESLPGDIVAQNEIVNWMSMVYMLTYIPLVFPSMFLLDRMGLKPCCAVGALLTSIGCWVKCGGVNPNRFAVAMTGQTLCGIGQAFTLGVPARLSSLWFGPSEISTATAIGVFGNQLGTALGFLIPPSVILNNESKEMMTKRFYYLLFTIAGVCTTLFLLSITVIKNKPQTPANLAQNLNDEIVDLQSFKKSLINLFKNRNFILIFITYGINTGVYYSISTLLNQILVTYYKNENEKIGYIGLILVLSGLVGALIGGIILDRTKAFKWTTVLMYILSFLSTIVFTFTVNINIWIVFGTAFLLGFFMTGYLPVGFEFAVELTYPEPEGTSSGLLNASAQVFGITFIYAQGRLMATVGVFYSNVFLCAALFLGSIMTMLIKSDLRRQSALKQNNNIDKSQPDDTIKTISINNNDDSSQNPNILITSPNNDNTNENDTIII